MYGKNDSNSPVAIFCLEVANLPYGTTRKVMRKKAESFGYDGG